MKDVEKGLDPKLWHACAGGMVQMPALNTKVFYFPQGHAEHAGGLDFGGLPRVPPFILCRVSSIKFMADNENDEVYAKIGLIPVPNGTYSCDDDGVLQIDSRPESSEKTSSFAKTLTQSDANNGGGFSVPRYCAETIFPRLDYSADPPVQTVVAKDVHGTIWKFRHIYRGTPRRHLLTTGWSAFVNQKKLIAGDSIVFMRADNGDLCVGIRRAKRGGIGGPEFQSDWNSAAGNCAASFGGFSIFSREDANILGNGSNRNSSGRGKVRPESVMEAVSLAANGQPFEVVYYPRASSPEFCVKASSFAAAMRIQWCSGMRFKMAFETEDSSRISWFMGTISSIQVADPFNWPNSPWRVLQVTWDEPDLLLNVKRVSPWLVELVSNMPPIHLSPFSPQRKKLRLPQPPDLPMDSPFQIPALTGNPLGSSSAFRCLSGNISAGIQGARHARFEVPYPDLHTSNKLQLGLFPSSNQHLDSNVTFSNGVFQTSTNDKNDNISCLLTIGNSSIKSDKNEGKVKEPLFLLFGQPILTEQQISQSGDAVAEVPLGKHLSDCSSNGCLWDKGFQTTELGFDTGHCKVFLESEDVGRTIDLSALRSYEELYKRLENLFGVERFQSPTQVIYKDAAGGIKRTGDEPFSEFMKTAKRLTVLFDSRCKSFERKWITGLRAEHGLDSSNQAGPVTIFA